MAEMLCPFLAMELSGGDLADVSGLSYKEIDLPKLGDALFEKRLLAPRHLNIHPTGPIALGDVGYVTKTDDFVVVDNFHESMRGDSGELSWGKRLEFLSGYGLLGDIPAEGVEGQAGQYYHRRT